jgi:hypothetical protein
MHFFIVFPFFLKYSIPYTKKDFSIFILKNHPFFILSTKNPNWHITQSTDDLPEDGTELPKHVVAAK